MSVEETEMNVEHESATHDHGAIVELKLRVSVAHHFEDGPTSVGVFDVVFERRGQSGLRASGSKPAGDSENRPSPLHWAKIEDAGDSDWFGPTHCAVVLKAADYVEDNYGGAVDTKQVGRDT